MHYQKLDFFICHLLDHKVLQIYCIRPKIKTYRLCFVCDKFSSKEGEKRRLSETSGMSSVEKKTSLDTDDCRRTLQDSCKIFTKLHK